MLTKDEKKLVWGNVLGWTGLIVIAVVLLWASGCSSPLAPDNGKTLKDVVPKDSTSVVVIVK